MTNRKEKKDKSKKRKRMTQMKKRKAPRKVTTVSGGQLKEDQPADTNNFADILSGLTEGLVYISETDAPVRPFAGRFADAVTVENLLNQLGHKPSTRFEEIAFADFFRHPIKVQEWFDENRIRQAKQYQALKQLLETNLSDPKVFKIGRIDLDIYVVGLDQENKLVGVKTKATET